MVASELANYFSDRQKKVYILTMSDKEEFYPLNSCINVYRPRGRFKHLKVFKFIYIIKAYVKLKPNLVLVFSFHELWRFIARFTKIRSLYIACFRTSLDRRASPVTRTFRRKWIVNLIYWFIQKFGAPFNKIIFQSKYAKERYFNKSQIIKEASYGNSIVIPNFLRYEFKNNPSKKRIKWTGTVNILAVGRLSFEKGHWKILQALFELESFFNYEFHLVGSGPQKQNLISQAEKLGVKENVFFHGAVQDPLPYYLNADIFVLPSDEEGYPNALIEAMSAGCAVVSSVYNKSVYEIIDIEKNGLLFEKDDINGLKLNLKKLISDPELVVNLGECAMQSVNSRNNKGKILETYYNFLFHENK